MQMNKNNADEFSLNKKGAFKLSFPYRSVKKREQKGLLNPLQMPKISPEQLRKLNDGIRKQKEK